MDTTTIALKWALNELIHSLEIMKKAQEELDKVVGRNRLVLELDLHNLFYLHAIVKENFHLHLPLPILLPHVIVKYSNFELQNSYKHKCDSEYMGYWS